MLWRMVSKGEKALLRLPLTVWHVGACVGACLRKNLLCRTLQVGSAKSLCCAGCWAFAKVVQRLFSLRMYKGMCMMLFVVSKSEKVPVVSSPCYRAYTYDRL